MVSILKTLVLSCLLGGTMAYAKVEAIVSILPQQVFLQKIGGEYVNSTLMVEPGMSPHDYEPRPSQMKQIAKADLYFAIGIEFEEVWLPKFNAQNQNMRIVFTQKGIEKIKMPEHHHEEHEETEKEHAHDGDHEEGEEHDEEGHHHHHDGLDPHVWTSPSNVKVIANNMAEALIKKDSAHKDEYEKNLKQFISEIDVLDARIRTIFKAIPSHSKFMVFHPAFGYFAKDYSLKQVAIEFEGKEPKPKMLAHLIEEAKEEGIKTIIVSPEFSDKAANTLAKEIGGSVVKISPLAKDWSGNLINLAETIAKGYQE